MAKIKKAPKKKAAAKAKPGAKKSKKDTVKKAAARKAAPKKKRLTRGGPVKIESRVREGRLGARPMRKGPGAAAAGQSGDVQGLSALEDADSESVEELVEEGQDFEASAVAGVEDALEPDESELITSEVSEDDVPGEYTDPN